VKTSKSAARQGKRGSARRDRGRWFVVWFWGGADGWRDSAGPEAGL